MAQWILLISAVVLLVVPAIVVIWDNMRQKYPVGKRKSKGNKRCRVNLIIHPDVLGIARGPLLKACYNAVVAVNMSQQEVSSKLVKLTKFNVYIVPREFIPANSAAYIMEMYEIPTAVTSPDYVEEIIETGEPVIHEACHASLDDYIGDENDHKHETIWTAAGGDNTLQSIALKSYLELHTK